MRSDQEGQSEDKVEEELDDIDLLSVRQNGLLLADLPEERKKRNVCLAAVRQNGLALKFVPKNELYDEEIYLAALQQNPKAIKYIEETQLNPKICLTLVTLDPKLFKIIPESACDVNICLIALKYDLMFMKYVPSDLKKEVIQTLTVPFIIAHNYLAIKYFPEDPDITKEVSAYLASVQYIIICEPEKDSEVKDAEARDAQLVYVKKRQNAVSIFYNNKLKPKKILDELLTKISEVKDSNNDLHLTLIGHTDREAEDIAGLSVEKIVYLCEKHPSIKHIHLLGCHAAQATKTKKEKEMARQFFTKSKEKDKLKYGLVTTLDASSKDQDFQNKCLEFCKKYQLDGVYVINKTESDNFQLFSMKYNKKDQIFDKERKIHRPEKMIHITGKKIKFPKQPNLISTIRDKTPLSNKELAALRNVAYQVNRFDKKHPKRKTDKAIYPFLSTIDVDIKDLKSSFLKDLAQEIMESDIISWTVSIEAPTKILHVDVKNSCFIAADTYLYLDKMYDNVLFFTPDKSNINYDKLYLEHKKNVQNMYSNNEDNDDKNEGSTSAKMVNVTIKGKDK